MIYLVVGEDRKTVKKETQLLIKNQMSKKNLFEVLEGGDISFQKLSDMALSSQSLFGEDSSVIVKDFTESFDWEKIKKNLKIFQDSETKFFFVESSLNKTDISLFEKIKANIKNIENKKSVKEVKKNPFLITNYFEKKDVINTWKIFLTEVDQGEGYYSIGARISWKIRDMISKKSFTKWTKDELVEFSNNLISIESEKRNAGVPMEIELERLILNIK
ncbi:hypothetical protein H6790_00790 [Candidatus Nomurabacteria bacterium]|nr:hypothetical protein [Candidatus Nomurabacteria bacterium]MCB9820470.1 hypothetical protein [Candidatus Nomurabacteria bacterium]